MHPATLLSLACIILPIGQVAFAQEQQKKDPDAAKKKLERDALLQYAYGDVAVVTVVSVFDKFVNPLQSPILFVQVHSVLRGDPKVSRVRAEWVEMNQFPFCANGAMQFHTQMIAMNMMNRPKVGEKWIVWGGVDKPGGLFRVSSTVAMRYSKENEKKARELIVSSAKAKVEYEAEVEVEQKKLEVERKKLEAAKGAWRKKVSDKDIANFVKQAAFVGVGKIVSGQKPEFEITEILKGTKRIKYTVDRYFVWFTIDSAVTPLLDRETNYLVFLTEKETPRGPWPIEYSAVPGSDGLIIADEAALRAVQEALKLKNQER